MCHVDVLSCMSVTTTFQDVGDTRVELNLFAHALNNTIPLMQLSARCLSDQRQTE